MHSLSLSGTHTHVEAPGTPLYAYDPYEDDGAAYDDFRNDQFGWTFDPGDSGDDLDDYDYLASVCDDPSGVA